jgi:hypothetical protein
MKKFLAAVSLCALAACSSAPKKDAAPAAPANPPATAQTATKAKTEESKPAAGSLSCKHGTDQRQAKIDKKGDGCEVEYTKFGKSKVVASSAKGVHHCEDALAHLKKNLTASGFACQ